MKIQTTKDIQKQKMNIWQRYAYNHTRIKQLEQENLSIKSRIIGYINREGGQPIKKAFGTFSLANTPTYVYSFKVSKKHEELLEMMKKERETGKATKVEKSTLRFTGK